MKITIKMDKSVLNRVFILVSKAKTNTVQSALSELNVYRLYALVEMEKKLVRKMCANQSKYKMALNLSEALTIKQAISPEASDILISRLYMRLDRWLPGGL